MNSTLTLRCSGRSVGRYTFAPALGAGLPARPYLHPVSTLGGVPVTEEMPADHLHHLGAGIAVPDVAGANFWGGRTYVRDRGPVELDNHGVQAHRGWKLRDPDGFVEELSWRAGPDGAAELLREHRTVAAVALDTTAWALDFTFSLTNTSGGDLSIGSPATNGRAGAGYGGFFWRAPRQATAPLAFTAAERGEAAVHGRTADWLGLTGDGWTLVFAGATARTRCDPWFVRTGAYPGVGSALAWERRLPLAAGETVVRRLVTVVADGALGRGAAAAYVRRAVGA
ncbi:PmoA family protein [Streptomyces chryseus]|uniref:Oxidoreductase n=1 Tax=Streptomyces chryseus TaxID=68186 RepID=A0ABQ3DJW7_9ACTN|nr:PmoA family protein [Streptomyces chryseus]GGX13496.1 oxidoreductase [Streptomyces chryseus]GHA97860.1 oxidoreductase [Streptomyces chryseus]